MTRLLALCVFWPMIAVVVVLAGLVSACRLLDRGISALSDLMVPAILALAEWADAD